MDYNAVEQAAVVVGEARAVDSRLWLIMNRTAVQVGAYPRGLSVHQTTATSLEVAAIPIAA
jgi:hypothetical protein